MLPAYAQCGYKASPRPPFSDRWLRSEMRMSKAVDDVIVHHPDRLHEGVADRRADEPAPVSLQIGAQSMRFRRGSRYVGERAPGVYPGPAIYIAPEEGIEGTELILDATHGACVIDRCLNLGTIADDTAIHQQPLDVGLTIPGDGCDVETLEGCAVSLPPLQDRIPTEARLRTFQNQHLEERAVVMPGHPPLLIVVAHKQVVGRPSAASQWSVHGVSVPNG